MLIHAIVVDDFDDFFINNVEGRISSHFLSVVSIFRKFYINIVRIQNKIKKVIYLKKYHLMK